MRGVAVLIAYLLGLGAIISFGIAGLMALQSSTQPTPPAPVATAPPTERVAKSSKQTTQKDAQSNQKRKTVNTTRKRREEAPTTSPSGLDAYGYANEQSLLLSLLLGSLAGTRLKSNGPSRTKHYAVECGCADRPMNGPTSGKKVWPPFILEAALSLIHI